MGGMWGEDHYFLAFGGLVTGGILWGILCRKSIQQRKLTIADLLALIPVISVVLGITSWL